MKALISLVAMLVRRVAGRRPTRAAAALEIRRQILGHSSGHRSRSLDLRTPVASHLGVIRRQQEVAPAARVPIACDEEARAQYFWPEIVAYDIGEQVVHGPTGLVMWDGLHIAQSGPANRSSLKHFAADNFLSEWEFLTQVGAVPILNLSGPVHHAGSFFGGNYYHWLIDTLPQILRARHFEPEATIVVPEQKRFVQESLEELGVHAMFTSSSIRAERLVVLDHRRSDLPRADDIVRIRTALTRVTSKSKGFRGVYVSRAADSRALEGEGLLEQWLEMEGFLTLRGDRMPRFVEQAALFHSSDVVIGPHGAGLSNMIFCEPGSAIIELLPGRCERPSCFELLARACGHRYFGVAVSTPKNHDGDADIALKVVPSLLGGLRRADYSSPGSRD